MTMLYIGFAQPHTSIDGVYLRGLRENGIEVIDYFFPQKSLARYWQILSAYFKQRHSVDIICAGYASPHVVIWLRLWSRKKIVYNALCSEYERKIISRNLASTHSVKAIYYWLLDILACWCADLIMVESAHQKAFFEKKFHVPGGKLMVAWTGTDDKKFHFDPQSKKFDDFTVLFRGRLLPEAGGDIVVKAAKILEGKGIKVLMLANGIELEKIQKLIHELQPQNLELKTEYLTEDELIALMLRCHVSLGQLSSHERLERTIPHKAYESLCLRLPYLTARNPAIIEIVKEGETCIACNPDDPEDLAEKILWFRDHPKEREEIAERGYRLYHERFTPQALAAALLNELKKL
ncbi:MAG: glycosyltransferase family 4 protein [Patescibacteria group bacterium]